MAKTISIIRRKPHLVDIGIRIHGTGYSLPPSYTIGNNSVSEDGVVTYGGVEPVQPTFSDVAAFNISAASNFDASYDVIGTYPVSGYVSSSCLNQTSFESQRRGYFRWVFDPSDYTSDFAEVDETKPFWVKYTPVAKDGTTGSESAPQLLLPYSSTPNRSFSINGTIGTGVVELNLPGLCSSASFSVEGSNYVYVAFEENGAEYPVAGLNYGMDWSSSFPSFNSLFIRGSSTSTKFYMNCRLVNSTTL